MKGQSVDLYALLDYLGPGATGIDRYQTETSTSCGGAGCRGRGLSRCRELGTLAVL